MSTSVDDALAFASSKLGLEMKEQQKRALEAILRGHDVFVCLPTGYGKSGLFYLLVFDPAHNWFHMASLVHLPPTHKNFTRLFFSQDVLRLIF